MVGISPSGAHVSIPTTSPCFRPPLSVVVQLFFPSKEIGYPEWILKDDPAETEMPFPELQHIATVVGSNLKNFSIQRALKITYPTFNV